MLASCEKKEIIFEGPYHILFTEPTGSARESFNKVIPISVHLVGPQLNQDIKIKYTVSGTAREGIDYEIEGKDDVIGELEIDAGDSFGYINLKLINNANNILESQNLVFTLLEVTPENLQIGRSTGGIIGRSMTFTIIDDCILSGNYTGRSEFTGGAAEGIAITSADCETYTLSNWNVGLLSIGGVKLDLTFVDNGDNTLTIPPQIEDVISLASDTIQGTGSVNPSNGRINFNIELTFETDAGEDTIVVLPIEYIPERQ
ncbi:hypothetical protein GXP67_02055 [Rhodocytophaga rosea]|uniref:Calx-beta domain-containing protein n=1 Tax=Rhodocytophaga rosea TaxID=2704465 RepID=A0A6C0GCF5_9BACT|nr:hypothetical protein [Rhodocytophaga rosea]QHT65534.1 hypothetical protein GXP67_02055 [Rhodocytophaga rosea]